jgi:carboxyl-terminal processing protease
VLPDQLQGLKSGEQFLDFALPWDTIQPVPYSKWTNYRTDLRELRAKSDKRVSAKQDFIDIAEQSKELLERQKKTLQSLNLDEAVKDRKAMTALKTKHDAKKSNGKKDNEKDKDSSNLSDEERRHLWLKEVGEDPYIQEGIAVLTDIIAENAGLTLNDTPPASFALTPAH